MMIMCQLSDAQHLLSYDVERANYLINAAKIMLHDLEEKEVDKEEFEKEIMEKLKE